VLRPGADKVPQKGCKVKTNETRYSAASKSFGWYRRPSKPKVTGPKPRWPTLAGYIWSRWQSEKRRFLEYGAEVFGDKNGDASHVTSFVGGLTLARNLKLMERYREEYGLNSFEFKHEQLCCVSRGSKAVAPRTSIPDGGVQDHKKLPYAGHQRYLHRDGG